MSGLPVDKINYLHGSGLSVGPTQPEGYLVPADDPMELDRMLEPV